MPGCMQKVSRFWDSTVKKMVTEYKELLEHKNAMVKSFTSDVYNDFDKHYKMWLSAVQSVAKIDALMSLAKASASLGGMPLIYALKCSSLTYSFRTLLSSTIL